MRSLLAAISLACAVLIMTGPAHARSGPDCVNVMTVSGLECVARNSVQASAPAKRRTVTVAGKRFTPSPVVSFHSSGARWVAEARSHLGKSARQIGLSRSTLWCGTFLAEATSLPKPRVNPNWADNWRYAGTRIPGPQPGAIALIIRGKRVGHVGIVTGVDPNGNPIIISGNHNNRVVETAYPASRVVAYVWPGA